jgi:hypothetical protein
MPDRQRLQSAWSPIFLGFLACQILSQHGLQAQTDTARAEISGTVVDPQHAPLEGVEVRLVRDTIATFTSKAGTFRLRVPRSPAILIQFRRPGFNAQILKMTGDWSGTVQLTPGAFALPDVQVTAYNAKPAQYAGTSKYDDVFRRKRQGLGQFLSREDIERRNALHTAEILEGQRGIRVDVQTGRGTYIAFSRCNDYPPKINVYIDGRKQIPEHPGRVNETEDLMMGAKKPRDPDVAGAVGEMVSRINPSEIEFIEIFRGAGELPAEFNDGNCGAIAIWTRQGGQ